MKHSKPGLIPSILFEPCVVLFVVVIGAVVFTTFVQNISVS